MSKVFDGIDGVSGFQAAGVHTGLKADGLLDFALITSRVPCTAAGVFTRNVVRAAPLLVTQEHLKANADGVRALAINTGSANAMTHSQGVQDATETARLVGAKLGISKEDVLVLSTGVIGDPLPMDKISRGIDLSADALGDDWRAAASAIMTTDTRPKTCATKITQPDGRSYTIAGIAKGAGMIAPNMGTMLAAIVTDARLLPGQAQEALKTASDLTFNRIVIDGDTSTNDTVLLLANGESGVTMDNALAFNQFKMGLIQVARRLAHAIVRDGEGVTKFITVNVNGAPSDSSAEAIARTIATSPLVKTAFFGNDANWGRIVAAAGRAGVDFDPGKIDLSIAPGMDSHDSNEELALLSAGQPTGYAEAEAAKVIGEPDVTINLELNQGSGWSLVWTTDFSVDYVKINADYRS